MGDPIIKLEPVTLSNIADGKLEELFQECMTEAANVLSDRERWEVNSDNEIVQEITCTIRLSASSEHTGVVVSANLKRPKRMSISRSVYSRVEGWFTGREPQQEPLFRKVSPIGGDKKEV